MRKLFFSMVCMVSMASLVIAADYAVVSYDKETKTITLKDGDKEIKAKLTDDTKVTIVDKDGNKSEGKIAGIMKAWENKTPKKISATIEKEAITELTFNKKK